MIAMKVLHVIVRSATEINDTAGYFGAQDPYAVVSLLPEREVSKRTLAVSGGATAPKWSEAERRHLTFDLKAGCECLGLELYAEGMASDERIGGCDIALPQPVEAHLAASPKLASYALDTGGTVRCEIYYEMSKLQRAIGAVLATNLFAHVAARFWESGRHWFEWRPQASTGFIT